MRAIAVIALLGVVLAGACHVKEGDETNVTGTIGGVLFKSQDAYATQGASPAGNPPQQTYTIGVFVTDLQGECGVAAAAGGTTIAVTVTREGAPVASETYGADGGSDGVIVSAILERLDQGGRPIDVETATSGSITMDIVEPNEVRGSLSLTFPRGSLSGTFAAPFCGADGGRADAGPMIDGGSADGGPVDASTPDARRMEGGEDVADAGPTDACGRRGDAAVICEP